MHPEELATSVTRLFEHSPAFPGESLSVDLIANPRAGGFLRPAYSKRHKAELAQLEAKAAALPARSAATNLKLHLTERSGHAADIARGIIERARVEKAVGKRIILTAGGDGTSLETATALVELPQSERARFSLLRLPMGTGNDGSEGRDLITCLGRILGPMAYAPRRAIHILPNPAGGKKPLWSFNIASIGLDAFVCQMTNRLKSVFPGDSYKFWVDVASVFYDKIWPPEKLRVRAYDAIGRETLSFEEKFLLCAMGVSGRRQYGSNKPILPDEDNVCEVSQMSLFKKLAFKDLVASGRHRGLDIARLFSASRLRFDYSRGILLQCEGEVTELGAADFPLDFQLTDPIYNVLSPA
jgi:Sphingosine kinase and enzymes related to eukaryotic diacylglycerol kinase